MYMVDLLDFSDCEKEGNPIEIENISTKKSLILYCLPPKLK
jgi:hypothetical protein